MSNIQLPAHLQNRVASGRTAQAASGMGSSLPPRISIQGNKFTFINEAGQESQPMLSFDGYIVDVNERMSKRYYDKPFDQTAQTYDPPVCWSSNGIGPSREATSPQAHTCEVCPQNVRGSAVSKMSNVAIKACRDERWIAVINPSFGAMLFQLVITPGSFKNWKNFINALDNYKVDTHWVLTHFAFEDKTNGVLSFTMGAFAPPEIVAGIDGILAAKGADAIVGRLDQPRVAAIAGPAHTTALPPNQMAVQAAPSPNVAAPPPMFAPPAQEVIPPGAPFPAPSAPFPAQQTMAAPAAVSAPPADAAPPARRRGGRAAQAAPVQAQAAPQAPFAPPPAGGGFGPPQGAAAPQPPAGPPPAAGNTFGIQSGAPVDPGMSAMLANLFPNQGQAG